MLLVVLFASFSLYGFAKGGTNLQSSIPTKADMLKSLIYNNTRATLTLDSTAFKELIQLSSDSPSSPKSVSFSVNVMSTPLNPGAGQTVKYDAVLTNDGNGYDDRTGVFTCPVAGTYMFVVDALSRPRIWLELKVNNNTVGRLHVYPEHRADLIQMSRTVIVKLKTGDNVKVENIRNGVYIYPHMYSGFSGTLLH
uniref:C1q domain-containing protein n=1 Tax=Magallana gigas TaxID=29159 RepID=A0A8W8NM29_MAGGI|nr:collagen alpha-2(VIII) chain [Crassostrea gigas]